MIRPGDVMGKLVAEEDAAFKAWEAKIDAALRQHDERTVIDFTGTRRVREAVMKAYREAGWLVEWHDDQRDGQSLTFTIPSPPRSYP